MGQCRRACASIGKAPAPSIGTRRQSRKSPSRGSQRSPRPSEPRRQLEQQAIDGDARHHHAPARMRAAPGVGRAVSAGARRAASQQQPAHRERAQRRCAAAAAVRRHRWKSRMSRRRADQRQRGAPCPERNRRGDAVGAEPRPNTSGRAIATATPASVANSGVVVSSRAKNAGDSTLTSTWAGSPSARPHQRPCGALRYHWR